MVKYWLDLFSPQTWEDSTNNKFKISGFREGRWSTVLKIKPGDLLVCYVTKISRFSGILKVLSKPYKNPEKASTVWKGDSFPCVLDVKPVIALDFLHSVPTSKIISKLSIASKWSGIVRGSPVKIPEADGKLITNILKHSKNKNKEYPLTKKITTSAKKSKKQVYGQQINVRGLKYAPTNEQGVVYLFALLAKDLGFEVEAIRTSFPDCEAMREISKGKLERVNIEFEYNSKSYDHPIQGCDIIVCWKHDWKECPLKVIELSEVIKKLN